VPPTQALDRAHAADFPSWKTPYAQGDGAPVGIISEISQGCRAAAMWVMRLALAVALQRVFAGLRALASADEQGHAYFKQQRRLYITIFSPGYGAPAATNLPFACAMAWRRWSSPSQIVDYNGCVEALAIVLSRGADQAPVDLDRQRIAQLLWPCGCSCCQLTGLGKWIEIRPEFPETGLSLLVPGKGR